MTTLPTSGAGDADATTHGPDGHPDWQATHVYYAANPRPLLLRCVRPLVTELEAEGLISGYFFINYWLEGPHVRLRIKPSGPDVAPRVRDRTEEAIRRFLRERPALYEVDGGFLNDLYNTLFELEFPPGERGEYLDERGRMRLRPNNSLSAMPYHPEYGKYGGPHGIEVAEWHFRRSSDLVIDALAGKNLHLRTVLLGTSAQLMMVMSACFLPSDEELAEYMDSYYQFWHAAFPGTGFIGSTKYDQRFTDVAPDLARWHTRIRTALAGDLGSLPPFLADWAAHCRELRDRVTALARDGKLVFRSWDGQRNLPVTEPAEALRIVLSPYLHMTNNRFHVTIEDEAYLSHMIARTLRERVLAPGDALAGP